MTDAENSVLDRDELLQMTVDIVSAYVSNNAIASAQIPELISTIFNSLDDLREVETVEEEEPLKPAVPIRKSIGDDYIICLEDGKKLKMLKRHLRTTYNLTPEEYRAKWGLPSDYPMVAPNYAKQRSQFAKKIGLGRKAK
ncbi:transcriptional regulator [Thalassospira lucentensis]|jgi:predicted transcriptional regulator|uniref:Transcriptional regulator n=2 Tax=Thalassospira TaxID=168934 RepID=A0A367X7D6_9PROT|nr:MULTISPECIES: MucR family transcriptional regulator [Thalassospira]KZB57163.1 transcriptional regulator [Thalassospira xiamenensis]KZB68015.1 transcriptional regulator [Thalassospira lucentensis]MAZ34556.1 transcriptional regulator [Thalassospira sp.]MBO9508737.1 MucR family transcriptional regulator [Thalassospira sp. A3_1]MCH2276740.1 MucR family transcriptional regulator [Thalassospira sp.]|tara:strand:+ start:567 stop:986 length:420 start_codon:yes stop_codon:yes gene_type:complete